MTGREPAPPANACNDEVFDILSHLRAEFDSHGRLYLAAYNMGGGNVRKALNKKIWPKDYASRVMQHHLAMYERMVDLIGEEDAPAFVGPLKTDAGSTRETASN